MVSHFAGGILKALQDAGVPVPLSMLGKNVENWPVGDEMLAMLDQLVGVGLVEPSSH